MSDPRQLTSIAARYDLEIQRRQDRLRHYRSRLCWLCAAVSVLLCLPWLLGDHRVFQSRCVSEAHRMFEHNCQSCHDQTFVPLLRAVTFNNELHSTSNQKCQACHRQESSDHLFAASPSDLLEATIDPRQEELKEKLKGHFSGKACAECHQEHRGEPQLTHVVDGHCTGCHTTVSDQIHPPRYELPFPGFARHPQFAIWRNSDAKLDPHRLKELPVDRSGAQTTDRGTLKFSHHRHLDPELPLRSDQSIQLACSDCHQTDANGSYFRPIQFEQHCRRCHKIGFLETGDLPHERADIIRGILLDRLARNRISKAKLPASSDKLGGPTKPSNSVATPGADDPASLMELAQELEKQELRLFGTIPQDETAHRPQAKGLLEAACTKCHSTKVSVDLPKHWDVIPPGLPDQWLIHSRFRHDRHASVDCRHCHTRNGAVSDGTPREMYYPLLSESLKQSASIYASISAQEVLMPRIEICRQCHGQAAVAGGRTGVSDNCIDCHVYHHTPPTVAPKAKLGELLNAGPPERTRFLKDSSAPEAAR